MNALIVEDERMAQARLAKILNINFPDISVVGTADSVYSAVEWLSSNPSPDIIFMDVELLDGDCFEIFRQVEIRSNVIFTDSWLRETFANELAKLSKLKAIWYAMESPTYNMKLFHFAEKYGSQAYGNLFWCETVINCPEEMTDVRLAAGSNGASMWWLNGEEVLLLEGDRRMVVDDGVSKRLSLKKGRNTLRGAVINGPGLSDMCVRFVDEQGKPIKGYTIE